MTEASPRTDPQRCPFCHEGFAEGPAPLVCKTCSAWHHLGCVAESEGRRCGACGGTTLHDRTKKAAQRSWDPDESPSDPVITGISCLMMLSCLVTGVVFHGGPELETAWSTIAGVTTFALLGYLAVRAIRAQLRGENVSQIGKVRRRSSFRPRARSDERSRSEPAKENDVDDPEPPKKIKE